MKSSDASAEYETYKFKMTIIENGIPKELLQFLKNV